MTPRPEICEHCEWYKSRSIPDERHFIGQCMGRKSPMYTKPVYPTTRACRAFERKGRK